MDCLVPGFYVWLGWFSVCFRSCEAEDNYPGTIYEAVGVALVIQNHRIWTTYKGGYDSQ
ncbi:MAG: hypothetical protein ACFCA4_17235 [Cyanophyceae cyanobacterium]